jgi:hypothetical protein
MTKFGYALQEFYDTKKILDVCARKHAFLAFLMANCKQKTSGEVHVHSLITENGAGRSAVFSTAQGNAEGNKGAKFKVETIEDFGVVQISSAVLDSSEGQSAAAFFDARISEIDGVMKSLSKSLAHAVWRSGSGSLGKISASQVASSTTLSLTNARDVIFLMEGVRLVSDSVDGGGTVGTTVSFVKSVDYDAGTFTVSASLGGVAITATAADMTAGQYLFADGDYDTKLKGVAAWIPATVASNDSFYGVNRSTNRYRLAGNYRDATGLPIEQAIIDAATLLADRSEASPEIVFMSANDWASLNKSLSSKIQLIDVRPGADTSFFFQGISINGPTGPLTVVSDSDIPDGFALVTQKDAWNLIYKGKDVVHFEEYDGNKVLRAASSSGIEARVKYNANIICKAPAYCSLIKLR